MVELPLLHGGAMPAAPKVPPAHWCPPIVLDAQYWTHARHDELPYIMCSVESEIEICVQGFVLQNGVPTTASMLNELATKIVSDFEFPCEG